MQAAKKKEKKNVKSADAHCRPVTSALFSHTDLTQEQKKKDTERNKEDGKKNA